MRVVAACLALAFATAGCAERAGGALEELRGDGGPPEPYFMEYREAVAPQHNASYAVPVGAGAVALQVDFDLASKAAALPNAPPVATLTVALVSPGGEVLASRLVDTRAPTASLGLTQFPELGEYQLRVTGSGTPDLADPLKTGASYVLTVEVVYA